MALCLNQIIFIHFSRTYSAQRKWFVNRIQEMEYKVILLLTLIIKVQGVLVSDNMTRNPLYDTRAPLGTNIILILNLSSSLTCASHCTTNPTCKSLLYNTVTRYCQLLSVQMSPVSDNGEQTSTGWRYYEKKTGKLISISI